MALTDDWIISTSRRNIRTGFRELIMARSVMSALVQRELKSRYRGSFLGFAWALGKPISMLLVFSLIIGEILGASRSIEYFALYLFVGLMFWGFFAESVVAGTNSIINASGLVQKVAFPREVLPLTVVIIALVNTLIQIPVLIIGYIFFGVWPTLSDLLFLVPLIGILLFLTIAVTLLLSAINVYVRDIQPLTELVVMLMMYTTPLIYGWTFVKERLSAELFGIYIHNPLATVIVGFQDALWPGQRKFSNGNFAEDLFNVQSSTIWILLFISGLLLMISYKIFLKLEPNFAREL
jgi:ABC-2 type transport system permease protein